MLNLKQDISEKESCGNWQFLKSLILEGTIWNRTILKSKHLQIPPFSELSFFRNVMSRIVCFSECPFIFWFVLFKMVLHFLICSEFSCSQLSFPRSILFGSVISRCPFQDRPFFSFLFSTIVFFQMSPFQICHVSDISFSKLSVFKCLLLETGLFQIPPFHVCHFRDVSFSELSAFRYYFSGFSFFRGVIFYRIVLFRIALFQFLTVQSCLVSEFPCRFSVFSDCRR